MTTRPYAPAGLLAVFVAAPATFAGSADAKTIHATWIDSQPLAGGRLVYGTTKIWLRGDRFSVDVTVANRTKHPVKFFPATGPDDTAYIPRPGFGIAWREPPSKNVHTRRLRTVVPRSFSQKLPFRLGVAKTIDLTFTGRSPLLRKHRTWWLTFGLAVPWTKGRRPLRGSESGTGSATRRSSRSHQRSLSSAHDVAAASRG